MKEQTLFEKLGGTYHKENGYFVPDLVLLEKKSTGICGFCNSTLPLWTHIPATR